MRCKNILVLYRLRQFVVLSFNEGITLIIIIGISLQSSLIDLLGMNALFYCYLNFNGSYFQFYIKNGIFMLFLNHRKLKELH